MAVQYKPLVYSRKGPYRGKAMVGTHSAIIGWSLDDPNLRKGLLGFAIRRSDLNPDTGEILRLDWLGGYKRFLETDNGSVKNVRSIDGPFQRFRWNDYTLKPDRAYKYEVYPIRGTPSALTRKEKPLIFKIRPSLEDQDGLGIYVNRGVTAAMAYLERFNDKLPSEIGQPAYAWLSRGLKESLLNFIDSAKSGESLHVAIYEFFDHEVVAALKAAHDRNVDLKIVHDAKSGKKSTKENKEVIKHFKLNPPISVPRTTVNISHNKIVIKLKNGKPKEVWTGSANFSENAFNFQTNSALVIRDTDAVQHFEDYFQALLSNPAKSESKKSNKAIVEKADSLAGRFAKRTFFSPVKSLDLLECAVELIKSAKSAIFISAPFGVDKTMISAFQANSRDIIEYGLVNSTAKKKIESFRRNNSRFFTPSRLVTYLGRKWDAKAFGKHKIHAKTIVVDPWSRNPKVLIGSANFSKASCKDNDENAMLITGNKRLAAVMTTEFMRMYDHYKSRFYIHQIKERNKKIAKENKARKAKGLAPKALTDMNNFLKADESWSNTAFDPNSFSHKFRDRIVFSGGR